MSEPRKSTRRGRRVVLPLSEMKVEPSQPPAAEIAEIKEEDKLEETNPPKIDERAMTAAKQKQAQETVCPYMGMRNDATSHMAFPSPLNHCTYCDPSAAVNLKHQGEYCLNENYPACEVYISGENKPLPKPLRMKRVRTGGTISLLPIMVILGVILGGAVFWAYQPRLPAIKVVSTPTRMVFQTATQSVEQMVAQTLKAFSDMQTAQASLSGTPTPDEGTATPSATVTPTPFPTLTYTPTRTRIPTATKPPTATFEPTRTPAPYSLDYPIGNEKKYIIHKVALGEDLNWLSGRFRTSPEAIQAVNYSLLEPIQKGMIIIIPLDLTDPAGLPIFEPYQVLTDQITIEQIAELTLSDLQYLIYYNNCQPGQTFLLRSWVLIPRTQKLQP